MIYQLFLACILKAVVPEYKDVSEKNATVNEGTIEFDVIFEAKAPRQMGEAKIQAWSKNRKHTY